MTTSNKPTDRIGVNEEYSRVASAVLKTGAELTCCGEATDERDLYPPELRAILPEGALSACRGCGNPFNRVNLKPGLKVLDLGSGGGIDVLIAATKVAPAGHVTGLDMTDEMIELANENKKSAKIDNADFVKGYLEEMPFKDETFDVVISNCVINLCQDKRVVLAEALRVLKHGGAFVVTDIVLDSDKFTPEQVLGVGSILGCTSGVLNRCDYINMMNEVGFASVDIDAYSHFSYEHLVERSVDKGLEKELEPFSKDDVHEIFASAYVSGIKK